MPRIGLETLLPSRLTGGPGPGGRVCRYPRELRVFGDSRVGIGLGEMPRGRSGAGGQILRGASWPARGGGGRRAACGHRRTRLGANLVVANSPAPSYLHRCTRLVFRAPRLRNPERHYANNPGRLRASRDRLTLTPALPQPRPLRCTESMDSALEKRPPRDPPSRLRATRTAPDGVTCPSVWSSVPGSTLRAA